MPLVVRLDGTNAEEGRRILTDAAHPRIVPAATMLRGRRARRRHRERSGRMSILVGADTRLVVQGLTGKEGTFHTLRNRAYGTQVVAGVTPGKAGQDVEGIPVFDTVADAVRETGRQHVDDLRAAAVRGRGHPGGGRRGGRRSSSASRRASRAKDMARGAFVSAGTRHAAGRAELPGRDLAGGRQRGDHPARGLPAGPGGVREPLGHARLSDRARAHAARDRPVHLRGDGRRPGARDRVHRVAGAVRGRPRHRPHDPDRRDRRRRRGARGRLRRPRT